MVVLRSREIHPTKSSPKALTERLTPEPVTPARIDEPPIQSPPSPSTPAANHEHDHLSSNSHSNRRRSLRLAPKSVRGSDCVRNRPSKRKRASRSSSEVARNSHSNYGAKGDDDCRDVDCDSAGILGLRSGKRIVKKGLVYSNDKSVIISDGNGEMSSQVSPVNKKLEGKLIIEDGATTIGKEKSKIEQNEKQFTSGSNSAETSRRYRREDKGKGKLIVDDSSVNVGDNTQLESKSQLEDMRTKIKDLVNSIEGTSENDRQAINSRMGRFRDIARKNAARFAHFESEEQQQVENSSPIVDVEMPSVEDSEIVEDWPGPFSTAMKIIRDRRNKLSSQQGSSTLEEVKSVPINWVPSKIQGSNRTRVPVPSLLDLCMKILVKNVDAVTSLDHVPDALRHRLCQILCDCRGMKRGFLELLLRGTPTEIRIKDCSWLTEEEFTECFGAFDTSNLSVLQLDQCGRFIADYLLPGTLARSSRSMPALIALSLSGACRLTDTGLGLLIFASPALRSINLSQCSLLTPVGITTLAQSLGSHLQELYIDDCQSLDVMLILPALKKLERLEVLSVAGIQAVCDYFVREFVSACGLNLKELVLANCTNLTDSAIKAIAETCPNLCALDLVNLSKLTDATLGHLANGCQKIQILKLCRNTFSDEAMAAFLETSGEPLKELSLNNVTKVGNNTALALARRSRSLEKLDLSWCRNLTDEAVGLIVDSCSSLKVLKLFGCGQITDVFLNGHSNEIVEFIGLKLSPVLEHVRVLDLEEFPLRYTSAASLL